MKKILVFGGTGFIGSEICNILIRLGHNVTAADNFSRNKQLTNLNNRVNVEFCDILSQVDVRNLINQSDAVINLAFINGTQNFYTRPRDVMAVAFEGQFNVLAAINSSSNVERFIYASSSEVYHQPKEVPTPEAVSLVVPDLSNNRYSYGGGKIIGELTTMHYLRQDIDWQIFRPHNIYGPRMGNDHVIPQLIAKIEGAKEHGLSTVEVHAGGRTSRSFCYITDFGDAFKCLWEKATSSTVYNIGTEREVPISTLFEILVSYSGISLNIAEVGSPDGGTSRRCPCTKRIRELGFDAKIDLEAGLKNTYDWYAAQDLHGSSLP